MLVLCISTIEIEKKGWNCSTHFQPIFHFYTPKNIRKPELFFSIVSLMALAHFPLLFSIPFLSTLLFINKKQDTFLPPFSKIFFVKPHIKTIISTSHLTFFSFSLKVKKNYFLIFLYSVLLCSLHFSS